MPLVANPQRFDSIELGLAEDCRNWEAVKDLKLEMASLINEWFQRLYRNDRNARRRNVNDVCSSTSSLRDVWLIRSTPNSPRT